MPFSRTGTGTALNIDSSSTIDWLGRTRKTTDAGGLVSWYVYKDDETRFYPAWDAATAKTLLPIRITNTDKEGRPEEVVTLKISFVPNVTAGEPNGTTTYVNADMVTRTLSSYNLAGQLTQSDRYHSIPTSGLGTRYTHYYRATNEFDAMGRVEFTIHDVADESTYDREQVTKNVYDTLGRLVESSEAVSDNTHDIGTGKPTMTKTVEHFIDDPDSDAVPEQGVGDGNRSWTRAWFGTGATDYNNTEQRYDWRNRLCLTIPPLKPYFLVKHDNLNRVIASGTYKATTNLDPGDDPATTENTNRLSLNKTYYDEWGRVYKTEGFQDPGDATPGDALVTNTYYDRRGAIVATGSPISGVTEKKYNGIGDVTEMRDATELESTKYVADAFNYLDDDENIVAAQELTWNEYGRVEKIIRKELNHDDTNGMDLTANDDYVRTYTYMWYDGAHRLTDTADYGTNNAAGWKDNGTAPTYGSTAAARSDTVLVTSYGYSISDGGRETVTGPDNVATKTVHDALGRATQVDEADGLTAERITKFEYNALGARTKTTADLGTDQVFEYVYGDSQNSGRLTKIKFPATDTANGKTLGQPSDETYDRIVSTYHADGKIKDRTDQNGSKFTWVYDVRRRATEVEVTTLGSGVDGTVRAITWTHTDDGEITELTAHSDTTPDTSTWTDAVNQIKYAYDAGGYLTKMEMDHDSEVGDNTGVDTRDIQFTYGADFGTGNYKRMNYTTYPSGMKVWYGYTHSDTAGTFQDTINDKFSRVGQLARDNSGSIGDIIAQYDFNGKGRRVRRVHDDATGWDGNDTRWDVYHGTTGAYAGLDRFGRMVDIKQSDFSGSAVEFDRFQYGYDRASNRTFRADLVNPIASQLFTYNDLYQLTGAYEGFYNSEDEDIEISDAVRLYDLDKLGNLTGFDHNGVSDVIGHVTNATNEITELHRDNEGGAVRMINETFGCDSGACIPSDAWAYVNGGFVVTSAPKKLKANSLDGNGDAVALADLPLDFGEIECEVTIPNLSTNQQAGVVFAHDGSNSYYAVVLDQSTSKLSLFNVVSGSFGSALASSNTFTISTATAYTVKVIIRQQYVSAEVSGVANSALSYNSSTEFGTGAVGVFSSKTDVTFDNYVFVRGDGFTSTHPRFHASADSTVVPASSYVQVNSATRGGESVLEGFSDDNYIVQYDVNLNGGANGYAYVRYQDPNNYYRVALDGTKVRFKVIKRGAEDLEQFANATASGYTAVKIKLSGTTIKVWVAGTLKLTVTDSTFASGGLALAGASTRFQNIKVGYDNNDDDDFLDVGDKIVYDDDYTDTHDTLNADHSDGTTDAWDKNGNLLNDGEFKYTYDAWNRLVKVETQGQASTDVVTIGTYQFDALGRRIKKVVTNSGALDGTTYFYYNDRWQLLEARDGSENVDTQVIYGTQYVDEIVRVFKLGYGTMYIFQDANWNVTSAVNYAGVPLERVRLTPYGEPTFDTITVNGDLDFDGDVDGADGDAMTACYTNGFSSGDCNTVDYDDSRTIDIWDLLYHANFSGLQRQPGRTTSANQLAFAHQGLRFDAETLTYQNRRRQYEPRQQRFLQPDPAGVADGLNRYAYGRNAPTAGLDPSGEVTLQNRMTDGDPVILFVNVGFWNHNCSTDDFTLVHTEYTRLNYTWSRLFMEPGNMASPRMGVSDDQLQNCREIKIAFSQPRWLGIGNTNTTHPGTWADVTFQLHSGPKNSANCPGDHTGVCETNFDHTDDTWYNVLSHEVGHATSELRHCEQPPNVGASGGWNPGADPHDEGRHLMEMYNGLELPMTMDARRVSEHLVEQVMAIQTGNGWNPVNPTWKACPLGP